MATDPKFSPDGRYISFIRDHGLVVRPVSSFKHKRSTNGETELGERRPTGASESVWNGEVDWVYEEELDVRSNYFWSPDSRHIAYLEMDESEVPEYPIVDWLSREVKIDRQRYPKAGERNPGVRIGVADLDGHSKWLSFTAETDIYFRASAGSVRKLSGRWCSTARRRARACISSTSRAVTAVWFCRKPMTRISR